MSSVQRHATRHRCSKRHNTRSYHHDRSRGAICVGLAAALLVAFLVFTVGVDQLSAGVGPFFLMALLLLGAFVAFVAVLNRARGGDDRRAGRGPFPLP